MTQLPDLSRLSHDEKDALILALWAQVQALSAQAQILTARVAELEAKLVCHRGRRIIPACRPRKRPKRTLLDAHGRACVARPVSVVPGVDDHCTPPRTK